MALSQSAVSELLEAFRAGDGVDLIREAVRMVLHELIETEAATAIGARRYERTPNTVTARDGARDRTLSTQAGDVSCGSRSCVRGRSSRSSSSLVAVSIR